MLRRCHTNIAFASLVDRNAGQLPRTHGLFYLLDGDIRFVCDDLSRPGYVLIVAFIRQYCLKDLDQVTVIVAQFTTVSLKAAQCLLQRLILLGQFLDGR